MLAFRTTGRFEKEFRLAVRRGKDVSKLQAVMRALVREVPLDPRLRDHALKGEFSGRRECHVEPDRLLVYKLEPGVVIFERTGTHVKRERLLFPDQRFRQYETRPGRDWREQLVGLAGHVHRDRSIRFSEGTVVEQKGAIYEMDCLLKVLERPGEPAIDLPVGNVVPAGGYPLGDSRPGCFHVVQSDKYQQDGISFGLGIPEKRSLASRGV